MVRLLMRMRRTMAAHQRATRFGRVSQIITLVLGLLLGLATLWVGVTPYPTAGAGGDAVALSLTVLVVGRVALGAFGGGDGGLRPEIFRLLPIPRRRLSRALLVVGLADPALVVLAIAAGSLVALAVPGGPMAVLVAVVGALLTLLVTALAVTIVVGMMPGRARRRQDIGTIVVAAAISLVAVAGSLAPSVAAALSAGRLPIVSTVLWILPTGWAADAVVAARDGQSVLVALPLLGLAALVVVLVAVWPVLLTRRLDGVAGRSSRPHRRSSGRAILPGTPIGGVAQKEVRMWFRDPFRVTFLLIAVLIGIGTSVVPFIAHGVTILLPFAGLLTILIAGAGACNLYGSDGLMLRLVALTPNSSRPDVRGRQLAWALIIGPYAAVVTVVLTAVSGQTWAWPWAIGIGVAVFGGALGIAPLASVLAVQTMNPDGGLAPSWLVKVYGTLISIVLSAAPTVGVLIVGSATGDVPVEWAAVAVAAVTGVLLAVLLGRAAASRLARTQDAIIAQLAAATAPS